MFRKRFAAAIRRLVLLPALLLGFAQAASAYEVLDNDRLRFGTGSEASVNSNGNLQQPFYYDGALADWFQLTFGNYPLDNAIGVGGDGTNEWNTNGTVTQNPALAGQVLDVSGFTVTSGSKGYGTIVSTGTVNIGGSQLEFRNTYVLGADKSFVKITTRVTNTGGSAATNVRVWVGTRDDYVGIEDGPTKQRGNLTDGAFVMLTNAADRAPALKIFSGETGVLFYSTSPKAHTSIQTCCSFSNAYNQNPATSFIERTNDGSYALFVRMSDLASGASEEFTWYYAAGQVDSLGTIAEEVAEDGGNATVTVTASAGTGGTVSPQTADVASGGTAQFTISPSAGYSIADVEGCGGSLTGNTYTTAPVTQACAVTASFTLNSYSIAASAGTGGTISPVNTTVDHGSTASFTVTANTGYSIAGVEGCAGTRDGSTYTTGAITGACSVTATFDLNSYQVAASAGAGGTVTPAAVAVNYGSTASFTITPQAGYHASSASGCNGSLSGATFTTGAIDAACTVSVAFSATAPAFSSDMPEVFDLPATALMTELPATFTPRAFDYAGRQLNVVLVGAQTRYGPGLHTLVWRAVDERGVATTVERPLRVWPTVSLGKDVVLGFRQGNSGLFRITLNGRSPVYPFTVGYTVSGHGVGHDLQSGSVQFANGETEKEVYFAVTATPAAGTPDRQLDVELDEGVNRGQRRNLAVKLLTANARPVVVLSAQQDGETRAVFSRTGGPITLTANIEDPNSGDTHHVQWTSPSGANVSTSANQLTLQPASLAAAVHRFEAMVTDSGTPALSSRGILDLPLRSGAVALPNGVESWSSHGLPNEPSYSPPTRNVLPERERELHHFLIEADPGVRLQLGAYSLLRGNWQAELASASSSTILPDSAPNIGGYFDFAVSDLSEAGQSVDVVIPQRAPIPERPVYRKWDSTAGSWKNFAQTGADRLSSAPGVQGYCPPPHSPDYRPGLNPGDWCVRLTLADGGPNDDDREANGVVLDPGGVASLDTVVVHATGRGGGGSFDVLLLLGSLTLLLFAKFRRSLMPLLAVCFVTSAANAQSRSEDRYWYAGIAVGQARGSVGEGEIKEHLAQAGYDAVASYDDQRRTAWRFHAGYAWTRYLAIEAAYLDLGHVAATLTGDVADVDGFLATANRVQPRSAGGVEVSLAGRYPVLHRLSAHARVGVFRWDAKYRATNAETAFDRVKDSGIDPVLSAGLEFALHTRWSARADWARNRVDEENVDTLGLGLTCRF